jgi:hypothetical protein
MSIEQGESRANLIGEPTPRLPKHLQQGAQIGTTLGHEQSGGHAVAAHIAYH